MPARLIEGLLIGDRYRLDSLTGRGAMGQVWLAHDTKLENRCVAIKFLSENLHQDDGTWHEQLRQEMRTLVGLGVHAHLVQVYDYGTFDDVEPYLVMNYMVRGSLGDQMSDIQQDPALLRCVLHELCDAIDFLHKDCGLVHLDLKPSNILFDDGFHVRLADFGIARALGDLSDIHVAVGTPGYRAPEQTAGALPVDHRADIYALGVITREMLSTTRAPQIEAALNRVTQADPAQRYSSAEELWQALQPWLPRKYGESYLLPDEKFGMLLAQLPFRYRESVAQLLEHYTHVFGGRSAEMASLDAWLEEADSPFALVQAPTGRGKTALLANWALSVAGDWHVVFFPISQRYGTAEISAVVRSLADALSSVLESDPPGANASPESLLGYVTNWLRLGLQEDKRLLLIVDGLDEAIGDFAPSLFPNKVAPNVKVLVSARPLAGTIADSWIYRLKWPSVDVRMLSLESLGQSALVEVVAGHPDESVHSLADDGDFIGDLQRVSEGDPLTARFLLDDLASGRVTPQDFSARSPGLRAYLTAWLKELDETLESEAAWKLLEFCAEAFGPLTVEDLVSLAPDVFGASRHVRRAVRPVARFLVGDGERDHGYAFSHTRLREFFLERLSAQEHAAYQKAFVGYGRTAYEQLPVQPCPDYVRRFWSRHLQDGGEWSLLHQVVATGDEKLLWAEMRYAVEGNYAGYLADLEIAWDHARSEDPTAASFVQQMRYALIKASVLSTVTNLPAPLIVAQVRRGQLSPVTALVEVRHITDPVQRRTVVRGVLRYLEEDLKQLSEVIASLARFGERALLQEVVGVVSYSCLEALRSVLGSVGSSHANSVLELIDRRLKADTPFALPSGRRSDEQRTKENSGSSRLSKIEALYSDLLKVKALAELAPTLSKSELRCALSLVSRLRDTCSESEPCSVSALRSLAPYIPDDLVKEAVDCALRMPWNLAPDALESIGGRLSAELIDYALAVAAKKWGDSHYWSHVRALVPHISVEQLHRVVDHLWQQTPFWLEQGLLAVGPYLVDKVLLEEVTSHLLVLERTLGVPAVRSLCYGLSDSEAERILDRALAKWDYEELADLRAVLAPHLPSRTLKDALLVADPAYARRILDSGEWMDILIELAPVLTDDLVQRALEIAPSFDLDAQCTTDPAEARAAALVGLMPRLSTAQRLRVVPEVLRSIEEMEWPTSSDLFLALVPNVPEWLLPHVMLWGYCLLSTRAVESVIIDHIADHLLQRPTYVGASIPVGELSEHKGGPSELDHLLLDATIDLLPLLAKYDMPEEFYKKLVSGILFKLDFVLSEEGLLHGGERRRWRVDALKRAVPFLPENSLGYGVAILGRYEDLSTVDWDEDLSTVDRYEDLSQEADLLAILIPYLPDRLLRGAMLSVLDRTTIGLKYHIVKGEYGDIIAQEDGEYYSVVQDPGWHPHQREEELWRKLTPYLDDELLARIHRAMNSVQDQDLRDGIVEMLTTGICCAWPTACYAEADGVDVLVADAVEGCIGGLQPQATFSEIWVSIQPLWRSSLSQQADILVYLASRLPASHQPELLRNATSNPLTDPRIVLLRMVPILADVHRYDALNRVLELEFSGDDDVGTWQDRVLYNRETDDRANQEIWSYLVPALKSMDSDQVARFWQALLRRLADCGREDLLSYMQLLCVCILSTNTESAVQEIITAIQDVGRWWP